MEPKLTLTRTVFDLGSALFYQLLLTVQIVHMLTLPPCLHKIPNKIFNNALIQIVNLLFVLAGPSCPSVFYRRLSHPCI